MRICLISFEFPPQPGGIGTYSMEMAKNLNKLGNKVSVLANTNNCTNDMINEFDKKQDYIVIRYLQTSSKILKILNRFYITVKHVVKNKYDIILIAYAHAGILGFLLKKLYKIPYAIMGHGSEFLTKGHLYSKFINYIFQNADIVFVNSNFTLNLLNKFKINKTKIHKIPLGADHALFNFHKYNRSELLNHYNYANKKIILTVGSLSIRKGHRYVIDAINLLKDEIPDIMYLIVGSGKEENILKNYVREKNLDNHIDIVGYVEDIKLPEYYMMSDVFILNSTIDDKSQVEGFGIVLIEANLMKKPVIGVRNTGMEDAIENGKNGLLINANDVNATTAAIRRLILNKSEAKDMAEYGYNRAINEFTWKIVAQKTNNALIKFLDEKR